MERERDIEAWLKTKVDNLGGKFIKLACPGHDGMPDRMLLFPNGFIEFVELKTETGHLSRIQEHQIMQLKKLGFETAIIYGMDGAKEYVKYHLLKVARGIEL